MLSIRYEIVKTLIFIYVEEELWRKGSISILTRCPNLPKSCESLEELATIYTDLEYKGAKLYAYKRLALQNVCSYDLIDLFQLHLVSENSFEKVINELVRLGYLNDQAWIESFIRQQQQRKVGRRNIVYKLKNKGFPPELIDSLIENQVDDNSDLASIQSLLAKRYHSRDLKDYHQRNKVVSALMRKGFDLNHILKVINVHSK